MSDPDFARRREAFLTALGSRPLVMGVLNVTPDSFSDGGRFNAPASARVRAAELVGEGADVIDIGAESTRPGFRPLTEAEEWDRLAGTLPEIAGAAGDVALSIDTTKAGIARRAVAAGCVIVNDQWGLQGDPAMADTVAETGAVLVAMHNRTGVDEARDMLSELRRFFDETLRRADSAGIPRSRLVLDPGVGFGKTPRQNLEAIAVMPQLGDYGVPWLAGLSRKSFLLQFAEAPPAGRLFATLGAHLAAVACGAAIVRVHDVRAHREALAAFSGVMGARR
ncbi:dihydropteroate synthase [Segnochrobactraceae bacterium EtOH-i3]